MADMLRPLTLFWIPLLVSLLGRSLPEPAGALSGWTSVQELEAPVAASSLPALRWQRVLHPRGPLDRYGQSGLLALTDQRDGIALPPIVQRNRPQGWSPWGGSARPFPLFPTGPPTPIHG